MSLEDEFAMYMVVAGLCVLGVLINYGVRVWK